MVNTRFWDDSHIARLSPNEKLVFLYLLTNPLTTIAGVYELSVKRASFDTGLSAREIGKILDQLEKDEKIVRENDWIGIVNFIRHQSLNPKVRRGIEIEIEKAPQSLVERLPVSAETLSIGFDRLSHSNPNPYSKKNLNPNPNDSSKEELSPGYPRDVNESIKELARRMRVRRGGRTSRW